MAQTPQRVHARPVAISPDSGIGRASVTSPLLFPPTSVPGYYVHNWPVPFPAAAAAAAPAAGPIQDSRRRCAGSSADYLAHQLALINLAAAGHASAPAPAPRTALAASVRAAPEPCMLPPPPRPWLFAPPTVPAPVPLPFVPPNRSAPNAAIGSPLVPPVPYRRPPLQLPPPSVLRIPSHRSGAAPFQFPVPGPLVPAQNVMTPGYQLGERPVTAGPSYSTPVASFVRSPEIQSAYHGPVNIPPRIQKKQGRRWDPRPEIEVGACTSQTFLFFPISLKFEHVE